MTVDVTYIELKNFSKYVCPVDIFGVPCLLTASYNSRKGQRLISLTSYDGEIVYLKPTFITSLDRVFLNFNMLLNELNVYVTLEALTINGVKQTSTDYLNWSSSYRLAFVSLPPIERLEGFRDLNDEFYTPPTPVYLTSKPYPTLFIESVSSTFEIDDADSRTILNSEELEPEEIGSTFVVNNMTVRGPVFTYTLDPEEISSSFVVESMTQREVLLNHTIEPENVSSSFNINSMTSRDALIVHTPEIENISSSFAVDGMQITN